MWIQKKMQLKPRPRGFHLVTDELLRELPGLCDPGIGIPIADSRPRLGTWRGTWLCAHRNHGRRCIVVTLQGEQA